MLIEVKHLRKAFGEVEVLKDVNAQVEKGEVISIIGPSGTGKSTFLRCLNRLERADGGSIVVDGIEVTDPRCDLAAVRRRMGMVFQNFNLFGNLTVLDNVAAAPHDLKGVSLGEARSRARELLARVGLSDKAEAIPDELSGGQKQRVAIARSLAMDPEILLFDEPTSALDPTMVGEVLTVIRDLAESGMTMLIVTHEMGFAHDVSSRIFFMAGGEICEAGVPDQVFGAPAHPQTLEFVGEVALKRVRDMVRMLREGILADGKVDELEAELLLRLARPLVRLGDGRATRLVTILERMLADGVITDIESQRLVGLLERL